MKILYTISILFVFSYAFAQPSFKASYNGTYIIPGQTYSVDIDKKAAAILSSTDSNWKQSLMDKVTHKIHWRMDITSVDTITDYKTIPIDQPIFVNINYTANSLKRISNKMYRLQPDSKTYILEEVQPIQTFKLTGAQKEILSYKCFEAMTDSSIENQTIWICYDLPTNLTPGIITNLPAAILEYKTSSHHYILTSYQSAIK